VYIVSHFRALWMFLSWFF